MARKVFVSSDMSNDERLIEVAEENPQAALIWPWILTAFDDWGRAIASPKRLKSSIFPMIDTVPAELIEEALHLFQNHGLLKLYEAEGKPFMCIPAEKWYKYQTHMNRTNRRPGKDKMKSDYPEPHEPPETPTGNSGEPRVPVPSPSPSPSPSLSKDCSGSSINPFKLFEIEGFGTLSGTLAEKIGFMIDDYTERWVIEAMKESVVQGKRSLSYVNAILKRWKTCGIDTPWEQEKKVGEQSEKSERVDKHERSDAEDKPITGGATGWLPSAYNKGNVVPLRDVSG